MSESRVSSQEARARYWFYLPQHLLSRQEAPKKGPYREWECPGCHLIIHTGLSVTRMVCQCCQMVMYSRTREGSEALPEHTPSPEEHPSMDQRENVFAAQQQQAWLQDIQRQEAQQRRPQAVQSHSLSIHLRNGQTLHFTGIHRVTYDGDMLCGHDALGTVIVGVREWLWWGRP